MANSTRANIDRTTTTLVWSMRSQTSSDPSSRSTGHADSISVAINAIALRIAAATTAAKRLREDITVNAESSAGVSGFSPRMRRTAGRGHCQV